MAQRSSKLLSTGVVSGHIIEDEGIALTQQAKINFTGDGVTTTNSGGKTVVTIPGENEVKIQTLVFMRC